MTLTKRNLLAALVLSLATAPAAWATGGLSEESESAAAGSELISPEALFSYSGYSAKSHYRINDANFVVNNSKTKVWTNIPTMSTAVVAHKGVVAITFDAVSYVPSNELLHVRVLVNGVAARPFEVQFSGDDDEDGDGRWARSHSRTFAYANTSTKVVSVTVQYRTQYGIGAYIHKPGLVIHHN